MTTAVERIVKEHRAAAEAAEQLLLDQAGGRQLTADEEALISFCYQDDDERLHQEVRAKRVVQLQQAAGTEDERERAHVAAQQAAQERDRRLPGIRSEIERLQRQAAELEQAPELLARQHAEMAAAAAKLPHSSNLPPFLLREYRQLTESFNREFDSVRQAEARLPSLRRRLEILRGTDERAIKRLQADSRVNSRGLDADPDHVQRELDEAEHTIATRGPAMDQAKAAIDELLSHYLPKRKETPCPQQPNGTVGSRN